MTDRIRFALLFSSSSRASSARAGGALGATT